MPVQRNVQQETSLLVLSSVSSAFETWMSLAGENDFASRLKLSRPRIFQESPLGEKKKSWDYTDDESKRF